MSGAADKIELNPQPTLCGGLVEAAATSLREFARRKGLALHVETSEDDLVLRIDRRALSQIVLHLLNNAIRHTEQGGVRVGVASGMREGRRTVEISVADTGVGIRPEDQATLFAPSARADAPGDAQPERPSLDLHRSQKLAEALGGRIELASEYGFGSTFTLVLPDR